MEAPKTPSDVGGLSPQSTVEELFASLGPQYEPFTAAFRGTANRVPPIVCRQSCAADRVLPIECCQLIVVVVLLDEGYVDLRTIAEASLPTLQEDVTTIKKPQLRAILAAAQRVSAPMWTARNLNDHHAPLQAMASVFDIIMDPKKRAEHLKGKVIVCLPDISVLSWLMADCSTPGQPGLTRD